ncbi:hypothetical protein TNIN_473211 [Trichonephila inaurata madagascariensis]|uniref:Uncharacterized protein n=1 Tax=Trichonephila inaurata madagascariensis TaxID=2747483 RepID=A0A8X6YRH6_9ARAC|nr:hypothetical protein TNIN_473211 [Trichonephila inaurata madagascariensis]
MHAETEENPSPDDLNKEFGSTSVQEVPSTDVVGPDVSPSAKVIGEDSTFPERPLLGVSGESDEHPRVLIFKEGADVVYLIVTSSIRLITVIVAELF